MSKAKEQEMNLKRGQASVEALSLEVEAKLAATEVMFAALGMTPDAFVESCRGDLTPEVFARMEASVYSVLGGLEEKYLDHHDPVRVEKFEQIKKGRQMTAKRTFV